MPTLSEVERVRVPAHGKERRSLDQIPPWHFLNFFPLPQGHFALRPTLPASRTFTVSARPLWQDEQVQAAG